MENSAIMSGTLNEPGIIGLLKPPEPRPETKDVVARQSEKNGGMDIVELSGESIQLTRGLAPNQTEQSAPAGIAQNDNNAQSNPESNTFNVSTLRGILSNIEASGTTTSGTAATNATLAADMTPVTPDPNALLQTQAAPVGGGATAPTPGTNATTLDTTNTPPTGSTASTTQPVTERTQSPMSPETNRMENERSEPNLNTMEGEAKELTKFNTLFNISNGLPPTTPGNTMNTNDVVQAQQPSQYSQQMLLQNLSSQLAPAVPPASVISVVG